MNMHELYKCLYNLKIKKTTVRMRVKGTLVLISYVPGHCLSFIFI